MKKQFLHIFISNSLTTALLIKKNQVETLFSNIHISHTEKIFNCLLPYHHLPVRLIIDTVNISIKTFDVSGMNWWHKYELTKRLTAESLSSDWQCQWQQDLKLILITGMFSAIEHDFLSQLTGRKFLIEYAIPSLWVLNKTLLKGHQIQQNGIAQIPLPDSFQQVLYLNGAPTIARISKDRNVLDWIQFVQTKYKIALDVLDTSRLITSLGKINDSFATYISSQAIPSNAPKIIFSKKIDVGNYYQKFNLFKQFTYGSIAATVIGTMITIPYLIDMRTADIKLRTLINKEQTLLDQRPLDQQLTTVVKTHIEKRNIIENFNHQSFPVMFFLEKISQILPNYGQVVSVRITPSLSQFSKNQRNEFAAHLKIVPFKNSKDLQLLSTELHKVFGNSLRVHIINSPLTTQTTEPQTLKYTVQINMTGLIHDLQRLKH